MVSDVVSEVVVVMVSEEVVSEPELVQPDDSTRIDSAKINNEVIFLMTKGFRKAPKVKANCV